MKRLTLLVLLLILIVGFGARLYKFSNPLAEWHSWRQTVTASVSRTFVNEGVDLLHPKYQDLSNVPSSMDNPNGFFFAEFPIYNLLQSESYKRVGVLSLEEWGRMITIFMSLLSSVFIFLLVRKFQNDLAGLIAAFFFTLLPYNIFYGRVVLPDPSMVAFVLAGIYFFNLWIDENKASKKYFSFFILASLFTALAFLIKPFAVIFALPMAYLALRKYGLGSFKKIELYLFSVISIVPLILWRIWMLQYSEGIPLSAWLFNGGDIRFKGAYFFWIFGERIAKLILGYWGLAILAFGFLAKVKKDNLFFYTFLLSSLVYVFIIAKGNVQHDYYQILIMPTIAIFLGLGGEYLLRGREFSYRLAGPLIFVVCTFLTSILSWYHVRDYFNINNPSIITVGREVDRLVPKEAKIIANLEGDTTFLYYTNRKGWASYQMDVEDMRKLGAEYIALLNPRPSDFEYAKGYKILIHSPEYAIIDLTQKE